MAFVYAKEGSTTIHPTTSEATGTIVNYIATFAIKTTLVNKTKSQAQWILFFGNDMQTIIYDIKINNGTNNISFVLEEIPKNEVLQSSYMYHTDRESQLSAEGMKIQIGEVPPSGIVYVSYTVTLLGKLESQSSFSFPLSTVSNGRINVSAKCNFLTGNPIKVDPFKLSSDKKFISYSGTPIPTLLFEFDQPLARGGFIARNAQTDYLALALSANPISSDIQRTEYFLVVDCSGSMAGEKINSAVSALAFFLEQLPPESLFNVIRFGSSFEAMFDATQSCTESTLKLARDLASKMTADLGGTDLLSPLTSIFNTPTKPGYVRQIFLITDGQVEQQSFCIGQATKCRKNHRIFSIGIGSDVSREFIEEISKCTQGTAAFVEGDIISVLQHQFVSSLGFSLSNPTIQIEDISTFQISPFPVPTLFESVLTHVLVKLPSESRFTHPPSILVIGQAGSETVELSFHSFESDIANDVHLFKVFSYFNLRDVEDKLALASTEELDQLRAATIKASHEAGLVSQFTRLQPWLNGSPVQEQENWEDFSQMNPLFYGQERYSRSHALGPNYAQDHYCATIGTGYTQRQERGQEHYRGQERFRSISRGTYQDQMQVSKPRQWKSDKSPSQSQQAPNVLLSLINLQNPDGSWDDASSISSMTSLDIKSLKIPSDLKCNPKFDSILTTVFALVILLSQFSSQEITWKQHSVQAFAFLSSNAPDIDWNQIVKEQFPSSGWKLSCSVI